jgi:hypothetical protein
MNLKFRTISAALILALGVMIGPAFAGLCTNTTDCTLTLNEANSSSGFVGSDFGTVNLSVTSPNVVTVTVDLLPGWDAILTGFPGVVGFTDSLGAPTIGGFSSSLYSGSQTDATSDQHFDGFGFFSDAAATSGPHNGSGLQTFSFTVTQSGLNDVNDLLNLASPAGGDGAAYFVVDAGFVGGSTGLVGVGPQSTVPEPSSYIFLLGALGAIAFVAQRRKALPSGN